MEYELTIVKFYDYQIGEIFDRFTDKHNLTEEEARRLLGIMKDPADIATLREALVKDPKNAALLAKLESSAYRARIERLENLQYEIDRMMRDVYQREKMVTSEHYANVFQNSYYRGIYEVQRAAEIANKFGVSNFKARRLVRTMSSFQAYMGQMAIYEDADIERYMIVATLDLRTSEKCREMDGKIFELSKAVIGVNMPPFHLFCRSITVAVFDDDLSTLKRRARDPVTGESKLILADTNYKNWYQNNVANNPKAQAAEQMIKNWRTDTKQYEAYKALLERKKLEKFLLIFRI